MKQDTYLDKLKKYISQNGVGIPIDLSDTKGNEKNEFYEKSIIYEAERIFRVKARQISLEEIKIQKQVPQNTLVYRVKNNKAEVLLCRN